MTVEHVAHHLPIIVRDFLREAGPETLSSATTEADQGKIISDLFTKAIMAFDDAIAHDVLDLFGGSVDKLDDYSDEEIRSIINDWSQDGGNWRKARLCMYGTTALVSLVDPDYKNLWVANLGDCQASESFIPRSLWLRPWPSFFDPLLSSSHRLITLIPASPLSLLPPFLRPSRRFVQSSKFSN